MNHEEEYAKTIAWLENNKVGERLGINLNEPNNSYGYIKLGQLEIKPEWKDLSQNDILKIISPYSNIVAFKLYLGPEKKK